MKLLDEILKNYTELDERVILYMERITNMVVLMNKNVSDYTKSILSMLVVQLIIYYKAVDDVISTNVTHEDKYERKAKSPNIVVLQTANDKILNLLDKIGLSPLVQARINKLNQSENKELDAEDAFELLKS